jgi:hypothetical protein
MALVNKRICNIGLVFDACWMEILTLTCWLGRKKKGSCAGDGRTPFTNHREEDGGREKSEDEALHFHRFDYPTSSD